MRLSRFLVPAVALVFTALQGSLPARAATFTIDSAASLVDAFTPFVNDNDVSAPINFVTTDPLTRIDLFTTSYASGNFDLTVALFDAATGTLLGQSFDDVNNLTPGTGLYDDVLGSDPSTLNADALGVIVPAGSYRLLVTQYDNIAVGNLADGFTRPGAENDSYTDPGFNGVGGAFTDIDGNVRGREFSVTVVTTVVPEAPSAVLALPGLFALVGIAARRRFSVKGN